MHIGLVGGIGPAATAYYYKGLVQETATRGVSLEMTIAHADAPTLLRHLDQDDKAAQVEIYLRLAERLKAAGAEVMGITSIAGHFCIEEFRAVSPLPIVDLLNEVSGAIRDMGIGKVGIMGTRTVMESRFYGGINSAEVLPPAGDDLAAVHQAYVDMAVAGRATETQRQIFYAAGRRLIQDQGAAAVMLGGTDLALVFDGGDYGFDIIDCAKIHIDALAEVAGKVE